MAGRAPGDPGWLKANHQVGSAGVEEHAYRGVPAQVYADDRNAQTTTCDSCQDGVKADHALRGLRSGHSKNDTVPIYLCRKCAVAIALELLKAESL